MAESYDWSFPLDDNPLAGVEAMVRAAGEYVRASDDLRPRVVEGARLRCGEQWAQRCIRRVVMCIVLLVCFTAADQTHFESPGSYSTAILAASGFNDLDAPLNAASLRTGDGDWRMLDAFTELRRQQAQLLRQAM
jgi:hypothetical protein